MSETTKHPMPASPLPWKHSAPDARHVFAADGDCVASNSRGGNDWQFVEDGNTNMAYIAWAANTAPALAAEVAKLKAALDWLCKNAGAVMTPSGPALCEATTVRLDEARELIGDLS